MITDIEKLACLKRELAMRKKVYPRWVADQRMRPEKADYELAVLQAIIDEYQEKVGHADLFARP